MKPVGHGDREVVQRPLADESARAQGEIATKEVPDLGRGWVLGSRSVGVDGGHDETLAEFESIVTADCEVRRPDGF